MIFHGELKKSFREHGSLTYIRRCAEDLIELYGDDVKLCDILENVNENEKNWIECPVCHGEGYIKSSESGATQTKFIICPQCNKHGWLRIPKKKKEAN